MNAIRKLLGRRLPELRAEQPDAGAAMLMTIMFIIFTAGFMLVLLAVLTSQLQPVQIAQKTTRTVYAAQAGIQAGLSVMRSNTKVVGTGASAVTYGDPTKLPASLTGTVDGTTTSALKYTVTVTYYKTDPAGKNATWLAANKLSYPLTSSTASQPAFARLVSVGSDAAVTGMAATSGNRTIVAVYAFTTTNINHPGGLILSADGTKCMKADSATAGSKINMVGAASCTDDTLDMWVYDTDWKLKLASTIGSSTVLCITGQQWLSSSNGYDSSSVDATLRACGTTNAGAYGNQLWSWDSPNSWIGQNKANTARSTRWLGLSGNKVIESTASGNTYNPQPAVGAGAASKATNQIVNYKEFGRCMDVTDVDINKTFMIVYPCKQDPTGTGSNILWNHKWYYSEPAGTLTTSASQNITVRINNDTGQTRCLTGSTTSTDVTMKTCSSTNALQKFVRNTETGNNLSSWTFQLDGDRTKCLSSVPESGYAWSHIRLVACDGSTAQKWNAPAVTTGSTLGDYQEIG